MKQQYRTLKIVKDGKVIFKETMEKEKYDIFELARAEMARKEKQPVSKTRAIEFLSLNYLMEVLGHVPDTIEE